MSAVIGAFRSSHCPIDSGSSSSLSGPVLNCSPVVVFFLSWTSMLQEFQVYRGIHVDVIVYIFARLHTTLRAENLLGIY